MLGSFQKDENTFTTKPPGIYSKPVALYPDHLYIFAGSFTILVARHIYY